MPAVSIVIPAYNAELYLAQTIESAINQSFQDIEIVVVDDGSTDRTAEIAELCALADPRVRVLRQQNQGPSGGRNRGWEAASKDCKYILFLDADDLLEPDALATLRAGHREHPSAMVVFGLAAFMDSHGTSLDSSRRMYWTYQGGKPKLTSWDIPPPSPVTFAALLYDNCIRTPGVALVPRTTLQEVGAFDASMRRVEDWDFWIRVSRQGDLVSIPQGVLKYRLHGSGASNQQARMQLAEMVMRRKMLDPSYCATDQERAAVVESFDFRYLNHASSLASIEDACRLTLAALATPGNIRPGPPASLDEPDLLKRDLALLIAIGFRTDLVGKILARAAGRSGQDFLPDEVAAIRAAEKKLASRERRLRGRRAAGFLRQGRVAPALKESLRLISGLLRGSG